MTWILGETVSESFSTGATGEVFTRTASYIDGSASVWSPTFTELGSGYYRWSYTPLVEGNFEWVGSSSGGTPLSINFDVDPDESTVISSGGGTVVATTITDTFILRDNTNTAITGLTSASFVTLEAYEIASPATTATVTLTEIGAGEYRISFTPTTDDEWTAHLVYSSGGVFREFSETYRPVTAESSTVTIVISAASSGGLVQTLAQLRERVARRFGDVVTLTATSAGTTTTFIDTRNLSTATESPVGREIVFEDGSKSRVTSWVDATGTLTFTPAVSATYTGVAKVARLYNKRGKGFLAVDYDRAINAAIDDAYPLGLIKVRADLVDAFDESTPEITVPAQFTHVSGLEWADEEGFWHAIQKATPVNESGWIVDAAAGELRLLGTPAYMIDGYDLRITGYGRQETLSADTDECALNPAYIEAHACYHLALGAIDKDDRFGSMVGILSDEMRSTRARIRVMNKGSLIRAA